MARRLLEKAGLTVELGRVDGENDRYNVYAYLGKRETPVSC